MDGARLQALQYKGHAIAARNIGLPFDVYRPTGPLDPMATGNKVITGQLAFFTPHQGSNFTFGHPVDFRDALMHMGTDASVLRPHDILTNGSDTYCVLTMDQIQPPLVVYANRTITVVRAETAQACGLGSYGGATSANEVAMMRGWPASILEGGRGKGGVLPGDPGNSTGWEIIFSAWPGVVLDYGDIVEDDLGRRYGVRTAELSHTGWRLVASEMVI